MKPTQKLPIMPKATAVWLIQNTSLTFVQIAEFCGIHELEVQCIADGEVASNILGLDPILSKQLTQAEIERCSKNPEAKLQITVSVADEFLSPAKKKQSKYTPIARRQDKPDAVLWLLKNYPSIDDKTIIKLIGTTKFTISTIRDRTHWNIKNIKARDPVLSGLCTQVELDKMLIPSPTFK